ncbi:TetR/AcrR family transcriptional regulator [Sphingomonas sp. MG17]|uniref:TetR/AcrR family transcriptional regulator n=1 Tax=Sphingomonas tagetis TaxID=2949092 RepID=A0A9X2HQU3_9SPHN|nr:TetR/AcrR family transcriptional regulator [Sphingomonas tagetis]MCP3732726.1 TetR/AcrR family transcriptional regulator [Sphingomonas tagetis]
MNLVAKSPTARRFTREDWIAAARKALVNRGIDDVKIDRLARQMRVTRGSFYWHFKHRRDLTDALLTDWEARNYFEMAQVRARWARTVPDMAEVIGIWLSEDANVLSFDFAVRAWARRDAAVADSVKRIDAGWIVLLQESFVREGGSEDEALVRARITYFHQIGYWALDLDEDPAMRLRLVPLYYRILTGREPPADLVDTLERQLSPAKGKRTVTTARRRPVAQAT